MENFQNQSTDTHLSKKYNDVLFDCIMRCNATAFEARTQRHYVTLVYYCSAVEILYNNTFMLFDNVQFDVEGREKRNLAAELYSLISNVQQYQDEVAKNNIEYINSRLKFEEVFNDCVNSHRLIMWGLQKRQMLVRMSDRELKGRETIPFWKDKTSFKKGGLTMNKVEKLDLR